MFDQKFFQIKLHEMQLTLYVGDLFQINVI